jgi:hypothetical protein
MTLTSAIRTKLAQRTNYSLYHAPPLQRTATKVRRRTALCFSLGSVSREFIWFPYENFFILFHNVGYTLCRSQWLCGLRLRFAAARLLRSWVRIPPGSWRSVCCECCVLSGRGLCEELITRPEKSYRLWCVLLYNLRTSWMRRSWLTGGLSHQKQAKRVLKNHGFSRYLTLILPRSRTGTR